MIERVPLATSTVRVVTERPRVALTVTLPASERRNFTRTPRVTRDTFTRSSFGTTVSRTSNTDSGGVSLPNGCSLSGGGGGGGAAWPDSSRR